MARTITGNSTLLVTDNTVFCNCANGPITLTLPDVNTIPFAQTFDIVKTDLTINPVFLQPVNNQTIGGALQIIIVSDPLFSNKFILQALTGIWRNALSNYPITSGTQGGDLSAKYILGGPDQQLLNAQDLSQLATGLLKNTGGSLSIGVAGTDFATAPFSKSLLVLNNTPTNFMQITLPVGVQAFCKLQLYAGVGNVGINVIDYLFTLANSAAISNITVSDPVAQESDHSDANYSCTTTMTITAALNGVATIVVNSVQGGAIGVGQSVTVNGVLNIFATGGYTLL